MAVPTLVLSAGQNPGGFNDVIDQAIAHTIPGARRVVVPEVSHEMLLDAPDQFTAPSRRTLQRSAVSVR